MNKVFFALILCFFLLPAAALAQELRVGEGGYASLTQALAAARNGDTITVAAGLYDSARESYPIIVDKAVTVCGEEGARFEGPAFTCMFQVTSDDVTFENLTLILRRCGIQATGSRLRVVNCAFRLADERFRVSSCGLWTAGAYQCQLIDCAFEGCGPAFAGLPISESSKGKAVLTGLYECGDDPRLFSSHTLTNVTVNGKPFYHIVNEKDFTVPEDAGGLLAVNCENLTIQNLDVSNSSMGLQVMHSKNVRLYGVRADACGIFGTYMGFVAGGEMRACTACKTNHAFDHRGCLAFTVAECEALECEQGVFFSGCTGCAAEACVLTRCGFAAFLAGERGGNSIRGNTFIDNATGLYLQNVENTCFEGNLFSGNTVVAVRLLNASGEGEGNTFILNNTGIIAAPAHAVTIKNNEFTDNVCAAIHMDGVLDMTITGNRFRGEANRIISLAGGENEFSIYGNEGYGD